MFWIPVPIFKFTKRGKLLKQADESIFEFIDQLTNDHEKAFIEKKPQPDAMFPNYIDHIYSIRDTMTHQEMRNEILSLVFASSDTSAVVISGILLGLAMNPDVQEKLFEELNEVFATGNDDIDEESLEKLTYFDLVIKEGMRLFPVVTMIARETSGDLKLSKMKSSMSLRY